MKKVLVMNGGYTELPLILAAKKLGCYVITTGKRPELIGHQYSDQYIFGGYSDCEEMLRLATEKQIDAVCPCANDFGVISASYIAEKLNLPGHDSYETAKLLHRKDLFKFFAKENGLLTPLANVYDNMEDVFADKESYKYPLIVKPVDLTSGIGVSRCNNMVEYLNATKRALATSRKGKIVVEKYIKGSQHGFCTYLLDRKVVAACSNDEFSFLNPYKVEIDTFPATGIERCQSVLIEQIEKIANILNLKDGIFHLQYIEDQEGPHIIEVMRRPLGNLYTVPASALMGFDWSYWEVKAKIGLPCTDFPRNAEAKGYFAYKTILANENGEILNINIPEKFNKYLTGKCMQHQVGDSVTNFSSEPIGLLFMKFSSQAEMKKILIEDNYDEKIVEIKRNT